MIKMQRAELCCLNVSDIDDAKNGWLSKKNFEIQSWHAIHYIAISVLAFF